MLTKQAWNNATRVLCGIHGLRAVTHELWQVSGDMESDLLIRISVRAVRRERHMSAQIRR